MVNVLIVGATRGLGHSLAHMYAKKGVTVYATARYSVPHDSAPNLYWIGGIDIAHEEVGGRISAQFGENHIDLLIICANYFATESWARLDWQKELTMYKTNTMGPLFLVQYFVQTGLLKTGSKVVLTGSEKGSIALRTEKEGAHDFGAHASKAALNMVGKLLSIQLKPKGIPVALVHTGYLRKQNPDGFYETADKHAVKPDEAAASLMKWLETFDISQTGHYHAIRGAADIPTAESVLGPLDTLPTPLPLPW